jgi:hypothetical protein
MKHPLKSALSAALVSSVLLVPAAAVGTFVFADAAYAKSENAGGKSSESRGKSSESRGNSSKAKSSNGKSSSSRGKSGGGLEGFFNKLTGKDKAKSKGGSKKAAAAVVEAPIDCGGEGQEDCVAETRTLHASELGKMNGALHANENAILAHIRNGNMSNGPVGLMAGYAYATAGSADARALLESDQASEYMALQEALGDQFDTYGDYEAWKAEQDLLEPEDRDLDYEQIVMNVDEAKSMLGEKTYQDALGDYASFDEYLDATYFEGDLIEGAELDTDLENAYAALGQYDPDTASALDDAGEAVGAYDDALAALYDAWNKGGADSENADDLKAMLDARVSEYGGVQALYDEMNPVEVETEVETEVDPGTCSIEDVDCLPDDEIAVVVE